MRYTEHVQERPLRRYGSQPVTVCVARDVRVTAILDRGTAAAVYCSP